MRCTQRSSGNTKRNVINPRLETASAGNENCTDVPRYDQGLIL